MSFLYPLFLAGFAAVGPFSVVTTKDEFADHSAHDSPSHAQTRDV